MWIQIIRRCVQASVFLLVIALAFLSLYAHYKAARVIDDEQLMAGLRGEATAKWIHPFISQLDDPQSFLDGNKGTVWSMKLFGVSLTDPLAAVETLSASKFVHWPLLISTLIPVVLTVLLGKVFCSWICPGYVLFELGGKLRKLLRFAEIQPAEIHFSKANKYIFLVVGLLIAAIMAAPFFALIYPPAVISRILHAWIFGIELTGMLLLLGVILAFEVFVSPRWWCQTMCPGGALYGVLGQARPLKVKLQKKACTGCLDCIPVCEAGINPITQSTSIECDNCGVCIQHCEPAALKFALEVPLISAKKEKETRSVSKKVKAAGLIFLLSLGATSNLFAHHVLGLPHYSYKENYPQRPTLEYPATTGPYDVLLTSYPGIPNPNEPANLAFYIKNRKTKEVFKEAVSIRVLQTSTFGENTTILPSTSALPFDNQHKLQCTFPVDGEYIVELTLVVEGREEVIPFLMIAGQPTATMSIILTTLLGIVILYVVVRAIQKKKARRQQQSLQLEVLN